MLKFVFISALALATPVAAKQPLPIGQETVITYAGNGGLRDWQRGGTISDLLYVRDRTEQWYAVRLSGRCRFYGSLDTLSYTTDTNGTFDRFSRISVSSSPGQVCGVASIRTSLPPGGHQGRRPKS